MDHVQLSLNGADEDYHILAATLSYGTNLLTFDDLQAKLVHYKHFLTFFEYKGTIQFQHALVIPTSLAYVATTTSPMPNFINKGHSNSNRGNRGKNCYNNLRGRQKKGEHLVLIMLTTLNHSIQTRVCR